MISEGNQSRVLLLVNFEMARRSRVLAWQLRLVERLSERFKRVIVVTESFDGSELAPNVEVHVVPRILQRMPLRLIGGRWLMLPYLSWIVRRERVDVCFVHMNMPWVRRLAPILRPRGIPVLLWYAHGSVTPELKRAERLADAIVTSTPEGFRLASPKVSVIGQGIDTELFCPSPSTDRRGVVAVGRVSRSKGLGDLLETFQLLLKQPGFSGESLEICGAELTRDDRDYRRELEARILQLELGGSVRFVGHVDRENLPGIFRRARLQLSLSRTGSMDKTVLEGLACGCPVLTTNPAFETLLSATVPPMYTPFTVAGTLALRAAEVAARFGTGAETEFLRAFVVGRHDERRYVDAVSDALSRLCGSGCSLSQTRNPA